MCERGCAVSQKGREKVGGGGGESSRKMKRDGSCESVRVCVCVQVCFSDAKEPSHFAVVVHVHVCVCVCLGVWVIECVFVSERERV